MSSLLPLTEENLIGYWLRSALTWRSVEMHRKQIPRYLRRLADQGVTGIPPHRARSRAEAHEFARADNLITLQILQLNQVGVNTERAHHLRNVMAIRPWH
jgi:hypothetical protein